jgi:uncharacterized membrane protein (UPF0182 family)
MQRWRWYLVLGLVLALFLFSGGIVRLYTDWLWFGEVGYQAVFETVLFAKIALGLLVGAAVFLFFYGNLLWASRYRAQPHLRLVEDLRFTIPNREALHPIMKYLILGAALFFGAVSGLSGAGQWREWLLFRNPVPFGLPDPIFSYDLGFYVFTLPFLAYLQGIAVSSILLTALLVGLLYLFYEGLQMRPGGVFLDRRPRLHLAILAALFLALKGGGYWLDAFDLLFERRGVVYGVGYADLYGRIPFLRAAGFVSLLAAAAVLWFGWRGGSWRLPVGAVALLLVVSVGGGSIYPEILQRFRVVPNEVVLESPFLEHNIRLTRFGYGLERIEEKEFPALDNLTKRDIARNDVTIKNVRLWDHQPLLATYRQLQQIRTYYDFVDVDNDRYVINGEYRQVMLSPRELNYRNLPSRIWINEHLTYTHGYGVTLGPVSRITKEGLPEFFFKDIPPVSSIGLKVTRPEVYYGEIANDYIFVNTRAQEFDYPYGEENKFTTYQGKGGVPVASAFRKGLLAARFGTIKILLSQDITADSRVLFNRNVLERAQTIAPFLRFDRDPYLVISPEGRMVWFLDAYTTSRRVPYSEATRGMGNYIRNAVKVLIDAYDGTVDLYVSDPNDPIIRAYQQIFPGLFKPLAEMPEGLRAHVRYPIDLFQLQARLYALYHMENPQTFYNKEDLWQIPKKGEQEMEPYYTIMRLPGEKREEYILLFPFTPSKRDNLSAWLAARADGEQYGKLIAYVFPKAKLVFGPRQVDARIDQDAQISQQITLWSQRGSKVIRGSLLVIPIEQSLLYIQPLYLAAEASGALPELRRVIVAYGNQVAMEENLEAALDRIFGEGAAVRKPEISEPGAPPKAVGLSDLARKAQEIYQRAQKAVRDGNWAAYGEEMRRLEETLREMARVK